MELKEHPSPMRMGAPICCLLGLHTAEARKQAGGAVRRRAACTASKLGPRLRRVLCGVLV